MIASHWIDSHQKS